MKNPTERENQMLQCGRTVGLALLGVLLLASPARAQTPPTVTILQPANGGSFLIGSAVALQGNAIDATGSDVSAAISWTSSLQGFLGTGRALTTLLGPGSQTITAAVTDATGLPGSAAVTVAVLPNAAPATLLVTPRDGRTYTAGEATTFVATAEDREDGLLTGALTWTDDRDGALGRGGSFSRVLSTGLHHITVTVADSGGLRSVATATVSVTPPVTLAVPATADTYVDSTHPTRNYGLVTTFLAQGAQTREAFLRFVVQGVAPDTVARARLRLTVGTGTTDGSPDGGTVYAIRNNSWPELSTTWVNRPVIDGPALASRGPVGTSQVVDFDVTPAIRGNGTYSLALVSASPDSVRYRSRQTSRGKPQLILTLGSPHVTLGSAASSYTDSGLPADTMIDARVTTFLGSPTNSYPFNLGGGPGVWLVGGAVLGQYDRSWTWSQMHALNNAAAAFSNGQFVVDGLRADDLTDGIRPLNGGAFVIRNVRLSYIRDDAIENDHLQSGLVDDSFFDGCYDGFSARPSPTIVAAGTDGSRNLWRIENTLVRLQPMPGPDGGSIDGLGNGGFFKWDAWDNPATSLSPKLALHNNVFLAERVSQAGPSRMGVPPGQLVSCSNNVMVWLGPGNYPTPLPPCFTVTKDRSVWDTAVAAWLQRHPQVRP